MLKKIKYKNKTGKTFVLELKRLTLYFDFNEIKAVVNSCVEWINNIGDAPSDDNLYGRENGEWVPIGEQTDEATELFIADGIANEYTLINAPKTSSCKVYLQGQRCTPNVDYTQNSTGIVFVNIPRATSSIIIDYEVIRTT